MPRHLCDIWNHFEILSNEGGKKHVACRYCPMEYRLGNATRMKSHILKCKGCTQDIKDLLTKSNDSDEDEHEESFRERESLEFVKSEPSCANNTNNVYEIEVHVPSSLENTNANPSVKIDELLARAIYSSGVPLSLLESKYWKAAMEAANIDVPSKHSIMNNLLDEEYRKVRNQMKQKLDDSQTIGVIVDRFEDINGKTVVNFIVTTPEPIFFKSINLEYNRVTSEYLSENMIEVIEEIGSNKVVVVLTDSVPDAKQIWSTVKEKFPHISCVYCVSHALKMLCDDILKICFFETTLRQIIEIIEHITQTNTLMTLFKKIQIDAYGNVKCNLQVPSKTRWSDVILALNSFNSNREALEKLANCRNILVDPGIREYILNEGLWINVNKTSNIIQPVWEALQHSVSNRAILSDVPVLFYKISAAIDQQFHSCTFFSENEKGAIRRAITKRKDFCIQPIHLAANLLDPRYRGEHVEDETPGATEFIYEYASFIYKNNQEKVSRVLENIANFKTKSGYYGKSDSIWRPTESLLPSIWWRTFAPREIIAPISIRLLSVPPSSGMCKRNRNLFDASRTDMCDKMTNETLKKLVYIRSNLRMSDSSNDDKEVTEDTADRHSNDAVDHLETTSSVSKPFEFVNTESPLTHVDVEALNNI